MAHGHTWGLLPACSPKGEEHIRKLLCRNRLRGLSWKGTSQSRLFATASKQPACTQSGHEPGYASETDVFSFCLASQSSRKTAQCCLEKNCVRAIERRTTINSRSERFQANHEKLYESEKRTELIQTTN